MPHTLTTTEIYALHYTAIAFRPDWHHNRPGSTWQKQLADTGTPMTLPHAQNFTHALKALHAYATTKTTDGTHIKRTPNWYTGPGDHWETTRPTEHQADLPPCAQHGTDYGNKETCSACKSEIAAGDRPHDMLGKIYHPTVGQPHEGTT